MPTRETRTQASMTIPLSRTRSRTSMRLEPPDALSTGMLRSWLAGTFRRYTAGAAPGRATQLGDFLLEQANLLLELFILERRLRAAGREVAIVQPPVEADLARF